MSANPKDERRAARNKLGSRVSRRANTRFGKHKSGKNRTPRPRPATTLKLAAQAGR